jgi:MFS family permease
VLAHQPTEHRTRRIGSGGVVPLARRLRQVAADHEADRHDEFATVLTLVLGDAAMADWGWRLMFGLGLLVVPVGLVIRSHLPELAICQLATKPRCRAGAASIRKAVEGPTSPPSASPWISRPAITITCAQTPRTAVPALALFGIGYVMRPVGGVLIGAFADRAGRKPAMLITIALMAVGMLMLAACPGTAVLGV